MKDLKQLKDRFRAAYTKDRNISEAIVTRIGFTPSWGRITLMQATCIELALDEYQGDKNATPALDGLIEFVHRAQ